MVRPRYQPQISDRSEAAIDLNVAEAIMVATALRAGGGITHGCQALKSIA